MQNSEVNMTKDAYFEMCEALGVEPVEDQIPVEFSDLPIEVQQCFKYYRLLRDIWDPMGGSYMGKDMSTIFDIFELYELDTAEKLLAIDIIQDIDYERSNILKAKQKNTKPQP